MTDNICNQFIAGFCIRENFRSEITQICTKLHDTGRKNVYDSNKVHDTDFGVLKDYEKVLNEVDWKIKNNLLMIRSCTKYSISKKDMDKESISSTSQSLKDSEKDLNLVAGNSYGSVIAQSISDINPNQISNRQTTPTTNPTDQRLEFSYSDISNLLFQLNNDFTSSLKDKQDIDSLLILHQYYAQCLTVYNKSKQIITLNVCQVCSHIYEQKCEHPFHDKYKKLRLIAEQMKNKFKSNC